MNDDSQRGRFEAGFEVHVDRERLRKDPLTDDGFRADLEALIEQALQSNARPLEACDHRLAAILNRHSMENGSDTPDYVLADFLHGCLVAQQQALRARSGHRGDGDTRPVPPAILAGYLARCLAAFDELIRDRAVHYGV